MSFAAVTWAYRDVLTSVKLAQMVENTRTHDHATTDQGARFGVIASQGSSNINRGVTTTAETAITASALNFTITANDANRLLVLWREVKVDTDVTDVQITLTEHLSTGVQWSGAPQIFGRNAAGLQTLGGLFVAGRPVPGTYSTTAYLTFGAASSGNSVAWLSRALLMLL